MEHILNNLANEFKEKLDDYENIKKNKEIKKNEYLTLFINIICGRSEVLTTEKDLKSDFFTYIPIEMWNDKAISEFLEEIVDDTSLCGPEQTFLNKMITTEFQENLIDVYKSFFNENVKRCQLGKLLENMLNLSSSLIITN